jgi:hypothetical protein
MQAMSISDGWNDRPRAHEDEYFHKRDQELTERARLRADEEAARARLAERAGVADQGMLGDLQSLGYTAETVMLLHVMPLLGVAWADGQVTDLEREMVVEAARLNGVEAGTTAAAQMEEWLTNRPSDALRDGSVHVLGAILRRRPFAQRAAAERDLISSCTAVASASGGVLGFGRISDPERRALNQILDEIRRELEPTSAEGRPAS